MALTDKLTAIGEAIREKSGKSAKLSLEEMPSEIRALSAEEIIKHADIPDYIKAEALDMVSKVQSVRKDDSIVFLAMSDNHHYGEQGTSGVDSYVDGNGTQTNTSNLHAAMAAKVLAYTMGFDFAAHLGDATWGHKTTNSSLLNGQIDTFFGMLEEAHKGLPCFHAIGNHDTGLYYHNNQSDGVHTEIGENLYNKFTAKSGEDAVYGGEQYGGYCYRDLSDKKIRVFLLNTSEYHIYNQTDNGLLGSQLRWFAEALLDLNGKSDSDEWKYLVLCHYPADYSTTAPLSDLLKAYVEGGSSTISVEDGTSYTANFAGKNSARFVAQFHGHIHNFLVSKLHTQQNGTPVKFDAWRVCIPNGQYNRENYYTEPKNGIDFSESVSYSKTADTPNDTSFVVNVINPSEEKIYSFCYGAGYDRVIGYAATVYYSITHSLSNVVSDNSAVSAEEGTAYHANLTAADGYDLDTVTVTMGGEDVTAAVVSNGVITIPAVTGNVIITATAIKQGNYTNQLRISTDENGDIYNGVGYKAGAYLSSGAEAAKSDYYLTGFIPVSYGDTLYFENCTIQAEQNYHRFAGYDENKAYISGRQQSTEAEQIAKIGEPVYGSDGKMVSLTIGGDYWSGVKYLRFCCSYLGADSVVTVNEPIE